MASRRAGGEGAAQSLRKSKPKGKDGDGDAAPERPAWDAKRVVASIAVLALVLVVFVVTQKEGGPPQDPAAGQRGQAVVESWTFQAAFPDGRTEDLCVEGGPPCDADELWTAREANATCSFSGTVWLAARDFPLLLRDVSIQRNATIWMGDYSYDNRTEELNLTTEPRSDPAPWDNGWWWRAESERIPLSMVMPCDTHRVDLQWYVTGKELDGDAWAGLQAASVNLHLDFLIGAGLPPSGSSG